MARRPIESHLYKEMVFSKFIFIERGIRSIEEIYEAVLNRYPYLCDNEYLCTHHRVEYEDQPEWKHVVRSALQRHKSDDGPITFTGNRGFWLFR